jgi:hypothetical protein
LKNIAVGVFAQSSSTKPEIILFSEAGQRNSLFVVDLNASSSSGDSEEATSSNNVSEFTTAVFEGFGYGQLRAQVPPHENIAIHTLLYIRTEKGLVPVARVNHVEKDTGSTFINIYAQLLVAPFELYKVHIVDSQE